MIRRRLAGIYLLVSLLTLGCQRLTTFSQTATSLPQGAAWRDGQHDFDFNLGTWKTRVSRLVLPLTGAKQWVEYDGTSVVSKVWNGRASLFELDVSGPAGRIEGAGLRLYNPDTHQWSLNWANSRDGVITKPMIGEFKDGRGEFFDQEEFNGRMILARNSFSEITANSSRFEQAFSDDGGHTWETNWVMTFKRQEPSERRISASKTEPLPMSSHDFDWEIGTWKTDVKRLVHPLTGSTTWVEYNGTSVVRRVWNGRANLLELTMDGPTGHFEGLSLRFYNPKARQWSLNFSNAVSGTLSIPTIGEFKNGRGGFYDQETLNGRAILVKFVIIQVDSNTARFEQSFSDDGGKTWELNWVAIDTRVRG